MKLTARDYYRSNDPEYLAENPDVEDALVKIQKSCLPTWCGMCYFGKQHFDDELYYKGLTCALNTDIKCPDYAGRSEECPLEKGVNNGRIIHLHEG